MRAIDADRLKNAFYADFYEHYTLYHDSDQTALFDMFMDDLEECPTLDVVPVLHGKWIQIWENPNDSNNVLCSCSVCGQNNNWYKNILRPYCPECGAKMDLSD